MKKTIWMPLVIGGALGLLDFLSLAANFLIPLGPRIATGPQEVFLIMSAALGGPLGLLVATLLRELGGSIFFLNSQFSPEQMLSTGLLFATADLAAHLLALLAVAYCYGFLFTRVKKLYGFFAGWFLIVVVYYILLVVLQSIMIGLVITGIPPLPALFRNNMLEFLVVLIISTLIWIALPARYHKPLWIELQPISSPRADGDGKTEVHV
ncbi:MAG: hypothetical protein JSV42_07165 [Chloroflexota bacterium]|nr:MAG: hypothetical protein JSV42_07165 [Chloroflexota bacterium]